MSDLFFFGSRPKVDHAFLTTKEKSVMNRGFVAHKWSCLQNSVWKRVEIGIKQNRLSFSYFVKHPFQNLAFNYEFHAKWKNEMQMSCFHWMRNFSFLFFSKEVFFFVGVKSEERLCRGGFNFSFFKMSRDVGSKLEVSVEWDTFACHLFYHSPFSMLLPISRVAVFNFPVPERLILYYRVDCKNVCCDKCTFISMFRLIIIIKKNNTSFPYPMFHFFKEVDV